MPTVRSTIVAAVLLAGWLGPLAANAEAQRRDRYLITREEILNSAQAEQDLFAAIRSLRAHFLQSPRGTRSLGGAPPAPVQVYVDGVRLGELEHLRTIMAKDVEEVRYLDPSSSQNRFGAEVSGGAIVVTKYKPPPPGAPPPPPPTDR